jgi:uncharacterized flavoprotein (TIGR03862 family)
MQQVAVIGAGPAGLMAAEVLSQAGVQVDVFDAMPSVGRKFLLAGIGGLNLTHAEPAAAFRSRFGQRAAEVGAWLDELDAPGVRDWAHGLGIETFVGSSQRVFPCDMKAAPLLRAWLHRLRHPAAGPAVRFHMRQRWLGWDAALPPTTLRLATPDGEQVFQADAVVLALGGGSWARLGSDGRWVEGLRAQGVDVADLQPANCGFNVQGRWSPLMQQRFAGSPLKNVGLHTTDAQGQSWQRKGECVVTQTGLEGSLVYAASQVLRETIARDGQARLWLDLLPDWPAEKVLAEVRHPRGSRSLSTHLKSRLHLDGVKAGLLFECLPKPSWSDAQAVAQAIKALPVVLAAPRPLDEAISSAGGVRLEALSEGLMLKAVPGVFAAGEMLDWEAPTGGYLLTACLASGQRAARGVLRYLAQSAANTVSTPV